MNFIPAVLQKILLLAILSVLLVSFAWLGIMPVVAVQVLSNVILTGFALVFFAEILISAPHGQEQ